ncbi:MAG: hypothetical protein N3C59_02195 [Azovibrio sp.]|nr:hypothetical protein [Azovibrio sp.]
MDIGDVASIVTAAASLVGIVIQARMSPYKKTDAPNQNHGVSRAPFLLLSAMGAAAIFAAVAFASSWRIALLSASLGAVAFSVGSVLWLIATLHNGLMRLIDKRL